MTTLARDGVVIVEQVIGASSLPLLRDHSDAVTAQGPGSREFRLPDEVSVFVSPRGVLGELASSLTARQMKPVRILFFDKTPDSNWAVPWHQDRTIAVKERHDVPGFGPWTVKDGTVHVAPPVELLEAMVTLRLFVDDCDNNNGPLEVACGSHRFGRIAAAEVKTIASTSRIFMGTGLAGDVLVMKLLAVHSSKRAASPTHRRVLHVDYASTDLPSPLEWAVQEPPACRAIG
jgi:hypothetical protein